MANSSVVKFFNFFKQSLSLKSNLRFDTTNTINAIFTGKIYVWGQEIEFQEIETGDRNYQFAKKDKIEIIEKFQEIEMALVVLRSGVRLD